MSDNTDAADGQAGTANGAPAPGSGAAGSNGSTANGGATSTTGSKTLTLTARSYGDALQKEREKGKRTALENLNKAAKELGFADHAAMLEHVRATKSATSGDGSAQRGGQGASDKRPIGSQGGDGSRENLNRQDRKAAQRLTQENEQLKGRVTQLQQALETEKRARRADARKRDAFEARVALEKQAVAAGVKDVDYAVELLLRQKEGKSEEELEGFDEAKFFAEELRTSRPYLFGETIRPATTGTGSGPNTAPNPGNATRAAANGEQKDAMKMDAKEYQAHLAKLGIDPNRITQ